MRRLTWLSVPLIAVTLLLGACGGDEEDGGTDAGDGTPTATETTAQTETSTPTAPATETAAPGGADGSGTGSADAAALAEQFANAAFRATYEVDGQSEGASISGEWQWYQDGPGDRIRIDFAAEGQSSTLITTPEEIFVCVEGACISIPTGGTQLPSMGELLTGRVDEVQEAVVTGDLSAAGSREIAGVEATCYDYEYDAQGDRITGTVCYSDDGVPLLIESDAPEGSFRMEATSFEDSVSDEDFAPPSPVTTLPGG
ncbi:MAG: hypothetical protein DWG80_06295 [Chloroflexi bacterium]|nr:hypothetical protein [Chloroflexota bacterium]